MTRQRVDGHSTEFGLWLRQQPDIDSRLGFVTSNIDYMWRNYKKGDWLFLEEKRHGAEIRFPQQQIFNVVDRCARTDKKYHGFYKLIFENTGPHDGRMWLNDKEISVEQLLRFLRFENNL